MPRKDKKKKTKGKKSLSTADILKLLKKLKPQTQQVVRVNVGDSDKKKKKGDVQSSYNPPFVFPQQGYPAITGFGQPPFQPPLIEPPRQTITRVTQPVPQEQPLFPPPLRRTISNEPAPRQQPSTPRITDISASETEFEVEVLPRRGRGRPAAATFTAPTFTAPSTFTAPRSFQSSSLSADSALPSYFNLPVQNDKFQADIIRTDSAGDQIGTLASQVPSTEWTGSPEGEITLTVEETQGVAEEASQPISLSDVFIEEPTFEELQQQQEEKEAAAVPIEEEEFEIEVPVKEKKKKETVPIQGVPAPEKEVQAKVGVKSLSAKSLDINEINRAVRENGFIITGIPSEYIASRGATKGQIKEASKKYITSDDIDSLYEDMMIFTGRRVKKAPFVVKKPEEKNK